MRISFRALIWSWVVIIAIIGAMLIAAYSKLEPKTFIKILNEQAQKNYPGSRLEIGKSDYRFSLDFNMNFKDLLLTRSGKILTSIKKIELKIPWWVIFFNRGSAQINISDLNIYVEDKVQAKGKEVSPLKTTSVKETKVRMVLPTYIVETHFTLRAKNINVKNSDSGHNYLSISKLLVREFLYGKNSAFELNLPIDISHKDSQYNSQLWLFGDVTPEIDQWSLHFRGEFKTKESAEKFHLDDLIIEGKASVKPSELDLISFYNLIIDGKQVGHGRINAKNNGIKIHSEFTELPISYLALLGEEGSNEFRALGNGTAQGIVDFSKTFDQSSTANLKGTLNFESSFKLGDKSIFPGKWKIDFVNSNWETSFISPKGEIGFVQKSYLDFEKGVVSQSSQEFVYDGIDFKLISLSLPSLASLTTPGDDLVFTSDVTFKNAAYDEKSFNGKIKYGRAVDKNYCTVNVSEGKSFMKFDFQNKNLSYQFNLEAKEFSWNSSIKFLEPYFTLGEGKVSGKIQGQWSEKWYGGTWLGNLNFENPQKMSGEFYKDIDELMKVFELDLSKTSKFRLDFLVNKNIVKLNSLLLDNVDQADIDGSLSHISTFKSALTLKYPKSKTWKPVTKTVNNLSWQKEQ